MLPPLAVFGSAPFTVGSTVDAEAIVRPLASSTTWTYMCATLRNTVSRGRSSRPATRLRIRCLIRSRRSSFVLIRISVSQTPDSQLATSKTLGNWRLEVERLLRSGLSDLLLQHFTGVADALLLVRVRLAHTSDIGCHLADELTIHTRDGDMRLFLDGDVDTGGDVENYRMRIAEGEMHLLALELGAVADADDVELLLEAVGDAGNGVGDETPRQAVKLAELRVFALQLGDERGNTVRRVLREDDTGRHRLPHLALRSLHLDGIDGDLHGDALRDRDRFLTNS